MKLPLMPGRSQQTSYVSILYSLISSNTAKSSHETGRWQLVQGKKTCHCRKFTSVPQPQSLLYLPAA